MQILACQECRYRILFSPRLRFRWLGWTFLSKHYKEGKIEEAMPERSKFCLVPRSWVRIPIPRRKLGIKITICILAQKMVAVRPRKSEKNIQEPEQKEINFNGKPGRNMNLEERLKWRTLRFQRHFRPWTSPWFEPPSFQENVGPCWTRLSR